MRTLGPGALTAQAAACSCEKIWLAMRHPQWGGGQNLSSSPPLLSTFFARGMNNLWHLPFNIVKMLGFAKYPQELGRVSWWAFSLMNLGFLHWHLILL